VSLWQPWASAIPLGLKKIETRGWSTKYRGPLLIHAAKRWATDQKRFTTDCLQYDPQIGQALPFGAVIARCELIDVQPTEILSFLVTETERRYGVYDHGRYGWLLGNIEAIEPIPFRGGQGFFNVPDELLP